jgi:hypothetical protein
VIHCLRPGTPIERPTDSSLRAWSDRVGDKWFHQNYNEIAIALVEGTSHGTRNSLKVLNLESNQLSDEAMARIINHLAEKQAPLEKILSGLNFVGSSTSRAIADLLINSKMLTTVSFLKHDPYSADHSIIGRTIVHEGLRYNFDLEEFKIIHPRGEELVINTEAQYYLRRNRIGREAIENERRDQWLELMIQNQDNLSALYYYLRKCPAWIYGHAD